MVQSIHAQTVFNWPSWLLFLAMLACFALAAWTYWNSPHVSRPWRNGLIVLRTGTFFLLLLFLFQPTFRLSFPGQKKPVIAVLLDASASMQAMDKGTARNRIQESLIVSKAFKLFERRYALRWFLFSTNLLPLKGKPMSVPDSGKATDLAKVLEETAGMRPDAALIFSDGVFNAGKHPVHAAETIGFPIFGLAIGDSVEKADVIVSGVQTNPLAYAGSPTPVRVTMRGPGFGGRPIEVKLESGGTVLDRTTINMAEDGMETSAVLRFRFDKPGLHTLNVSTNSLAGEAAFGNNTKTLAVDVLRSKMKVFLLADAPSPDLAFLKRILLADSMVEAKVRTLKSGLDFFEGVFPSDRDLRETDEIWLLDVPSRRFPESLWSKITSSILRDGKSFFLIAGANLDAARLQPIERFLPVRFNNPASERLVEAAITKEGLVHPLLQLENPDGLDKLDLPPVFSRWNQAQIVPPGRTLIEAVLDGESRQPLLTIRSADGPKSAVVLARGLFRWELMMLGKGVFRTWISNAVRWLGARKEDRLVRMEVQRTVVQAGEENEFLVQVYDESLKPVEGANVAIRFLTPPDQPETELLDEGGGFYRAAFRPLREGRYRVEAEARSNGFIFGKDTAEFAVIPLNPEWLDTRARPEVLALMAEKTGGTSGSPEHLDSVLQSIRIPGKAVVQKREWEIAFRPMALGLVLFLLASEWFIRRRKGLM